MAKDLFHQAVKQALIKKGWKITNDPLTIRIDSIKLEIDLGAERIIGAEKDGQKIAVEIKSFINPSNISDFHNALGQFLSYRVALQMTETDRFLYLAVPSDVFQTFFQERFTQAAISTYDLKIISYEPTREEIVEWKN
ncbi:MAG: XisH family protein [Snowella sp.]|nr:XisH family protein [Snowella sp.]